MLTTADNPYDPRTQFDEWLQFDIENGYNTCGYIARIAEYYGIEDDNDDDYAYDQAVQEILKYNLTGNYVLV